MYFMTFYELKYIMECIKRLKLYHGTTTFNTPYNDHEDLLQQLQLTTVHLFIYSQIALHYASLSIPIYN